MSSSLQLIYSSSSSSRTSALNTEADALIVIRTDVVANGQACARDVACAAAKYRATLAEYAWGAA